jgi:hypothetical protein
LLFTVGYFRGFLIFTMIFAAIAALEVVAVALCLDGFRTKQRGLYWVLKARRSPRA